MINSPIVIFIYKRIENLDSICSVLNIVKPKTIYIVGDGPKNEQELKLVQETRAKLESLIAWPCQVHKNYSNTNLGLKIRFRTGIDWVFQSKDRAIFLEDDCLPDQSFFRFCDELLDKYKNDDRITTISGNNFQFDKKVTNNSYYFSRYPHIWGWATWKRVWDQYDSSISDWPTFRDSSWLQKTTGGFLISKFWKYIFDRLYNGRINTWDYQLTYLSFKNNGLNIIPAHNLVANVGYGEDSTNVKKLNKAINVPTLPIHFPLVHPKQYQVNYAADQQIDNLVYLHPLGKISLFIKSIFGLL